MKIYRTDLLKAGTARLLLILALAGTALPLLRAQNDHRWDEGVSLELAQERKQAIQALSYQLYFRIPEARDQAIEASECIRFTLKQAREVVLDFRESADKIHRVKANGRSCHYRIVNDHIVLPASALRRGKNRIELDFTAGEQSLNRRDGYVYTLFVPDRARTAFPCFDQPNLKASFTLQLMIPRHWKAVCNTAERTNGKEDATTRKRRKAEEAEGYRLWSFEASEPLPTYLFAFAAGEFQYTYFPEERLGAFYRETDPARVAQLPEIARQIAFALHWQEEFTGVKYPFRKYDFVVLPGFQFGGMEHTGATFYNDNTLFLPPKPTPDEELRRTQLIAHETSHMWFGDAVTMEWFDDVWTKEVFANYFAAEITAPLFPQLNHELNWLKTYTAAAVAQDRTEGRTRIRQPLDNLRNAGLIYNNIIYNKAPVMMKRMVEMMGKEAFRRGIQKYVRTYKYGNATWDDLVRILDAETPADLTGFSREWVDTERWPRYKASSYLEGRDGKRYGFTELDSLQTDSLMRYWPTEQEGTARQALLMNLHENFCAGRIGTERWLRFLLASLERETDLLTAATLTGYLHEPMQLRLQAQLEGDEAVNERLTSMARQHPLPSVRTLLLRLLMRQGYSPALTERMYALWKKGADERLSANDFTTMAYELAVRMPERAADILKVQRSRITNPDRLQQFDFIARAAVASEAARDTLFASLAAAEARRIEPWTLSALYYLNHPLRDRQSVKYILPALEWLPDIQRTGDIFFPANWCSNLLAGHRSAEALEAVERYLKEHPELHPLLRKKILTAAYYLQRAQRPTEE